MTSGLLNLLAFVMNPRTDMLELVKLVFQNPKSLHFRDDYGIKLASEKNKLHRASKDFFC
jgi:hypothetical protein